MACPSYNPAEAHRLPRAVETTLRRAPAMYYPFGVMSAFCEHLVKKGRITASQLALVTDRAQNLNLKTGLCAYAFGFLQESHIRKILAIQNRTGQRFGEIAIALGILNQGQLNTILRIQKKYHVAAEEVLIMEGILSREEFDAEMRDFSSGGITPLPS